MKKLILPKQLLPKKIRSKLALSLLSVSVLYATPALFAEPLQVNVAHAAEAKSEKKSKRVPAMRNRVYTQFARAQKLADEGDRPAGFEVLNDVKDRIDSLNAYERAMLWNFYGFMHYGADDLKSAIESFEKVVQEEAIPESLKISTLYSLAQLAMQQQDYGKALGYLNQWKSVNTKSLTANQHMLFAQVFYQDKNYQKTLNAVNDAIELAKAKNEKPKENWLILQRAAYYELGQPKDVTRVIEQLVRLYEKPQYWLQLGGMYGEIGEETKQLAVMETAWQAGYITKSSEIVSLAQLYRYHGVPYKAAKLLSDAIEQGLVTAEEKHLESMAQAYVAAKEDEKAIPVLVKASEIAETGKFDAQLAQAYLNLEQWENALSSAEKAVERGGIDQIGNMYLAIGMANFNLQNFEQSLKAFDNAKKIKASAKMAQQWHQYVEREQSQHLRLAMLN